MRSHGWEGRPASHLLPLMSIHPDIPVLLSHKGRHCSGGQSPGWLTQQGATFGTVLVKSWVQCLGFSFLLKKEQIRSVELLQLGLMERTAGGFIPIRIHTYTHAWAILVRAPQTQTFCFFVSPWTLLREPAWPVIVLNPKYLRHHVTRSAVLGSPAPA